VKGVLSPTLQTCGTEAGFNSDGLHAWMVCVLWYGVSECECECECESECECE